jgi:hypothetical protein
MVASQEATEKREENPHKAPQYGKPAVSITVPR